MVDPTPAVTVNTLGDSYHVDPFGEYHTRVDRRKIVAVAGVLFLLVAIPVYVLSAGGDPIGANVQPRYVLPLIVLLGGLLLFDPPGKRIRFSRG